MKRELKFLLDKFRAWENIQPLLVDNDEICVIINYLNDSNIESIQDIENEYIQNVFVFKTEEKSFKIEKTREIIEKASIKPSWSFNIFIIEEIDKFTDQAGNSLLKVLEDVPKWIIFLLTSNSKENIIETITSRILFFSTNSTIYELNDEIKAKIDNFFRGSKNEFISYIFSSKIEKSEYLAILYYIKERLKESDQDALIYKLIEESIQNIYSTNANAKWIVDMVVLSLK
ncbi:MAG: hypothetical protein ACD_49C00026G0020 [uncultured bacterium (gcode 4)]|uniref:Uncharacterized protein n=1 Tax=uncultured bacterium (gcode 4) TaxID=1234023 RepID=K2AFB8_9BACT|nr:MAG: hypothetical protein ACD_49C00026G0020 [uncultured bacterium (gcode 4)]